eukprot:TRINITY_DN35889_c0_g1_i1.p1 TRINITY_DN35889_c0_g1~~TRINITY_DN35889_c0_g1_i1.p1  ORF type:complete len:951 (-),score=112.34 TRINITY_DN35889_c0_g1_i1:430-3234(-)
MAPMPSSSFLFLLIVVFVQLLPYSFAFKAHEFKKCEESHFCKRNRNRSPSPDAYFVSDASINVGGVFTATLHKNDMETLDDKGEAAHFTLTVSAFNSSVSLDSNECSSIFRVKIDEDKSKGRFQVPEVVESDLESKRLPLVTSPLSHPGMSARLEILDHPENNLEINFSPFQITAYRGEDAIMQINSKGLFNFEERRQKKEGEEGGLWEETFRSHADAKLKGPESISFDLSFPGVEHVYGIPEHATRLALKPTKGPSVTSEPYRLYNLDVFEYDHESPFGLYGSIPVMLAHRPGQTSGFFWLNSAEMWIDVLEKNEASAQKETVTQWTAESGIFDGFFFFGPSPKDVVVQYTDVTGKTSMPPMFAIAYHQCRWNYRDETDVSQVDANFDSYDIPYDVLWLDIEHTDGKKYMTWDNNHFPTPERMQNEIGAKGRHMVTIVDPHMKRDAGYALHQESTQLGYYVKDKNGNDFDGWCWPGSSSYLDMLSPKIRSWWADKFSLQNYKGSTPILHIWNDMNEPSVFNGPEVTMPKDNVHFGGVEHRDVHNAYGYYYHMASALGLLRRGGMNERPFVLSRAVFAGTQKVGPIWTGDNTADWNHLNVSVPMVLTMGLSGVAFAGADVGGFFRDPDGELMTRWFQLGAFYPFFRGHAHLDTKRREPWIFGEPYTSHIREAIRIRYALLPYFYSLFREAASSGVPVMRPLWMEFPNDESTYAMDDSFLLGPALLVKPVASSGAQSVSMYFPGDQPWYHFYNGEAYATGSARTLDIPVDLGSVLAFQRAGTIIPRKERARRSTTQMELDPYTLVIAVDSKGQAKGELYIDDGHSYDFQKGAFIHAHFTLINGKLKSKTGRTGTFSKSYRTTVQVERIVVLGVSPKKAAMAKSATLEGREPQTLEVDSGPAFVRPGLPSTAVIIRLPSLPIGSDWSINCPFLRSS